jgi:hypothetical protein
MGSAVTLREEAWRGSPIRAVTVPRWHAGLDAPVLPRPCQDLLEVGGSACAL